MRSEPNLRIEKFRAGGPDNTNTGVFDMLRHGQYLKVIASDGGGWDHVSVSRPERCPVWEEMAWIKAQFFKDDETVMELHLPTAQHINNHRYCLHLWRPQTQEEIDRGMKMAKDAELEWPEGWPTISPGSIPLPPPIFVGVAGLNPDQLQKVNVKQTALGTVLINGVEVPVSEMKSHVDDLLLKAAASPKCKLDTDGDGNCPRHPEGCPPHADEGEEAYKEHTQIPGVIQ